MLFPSLLRLYMYYRERDEMKSSTEEVGIYNIIPTSYLPPSFRKKRRSARESQRREPLIRVYSWRKRFGGSNTYIAPRELKSA